MSVVQQWRRSWRPDHVALVLPDGVTVSYGELERRVGQAATWLGARGIGPGSVVAMQLPKDRRFLELHLALLGIGATTLPMNTQYTAAEVSFLVDDAGADLVLVDDGAPDPGRPALPLAAIDYSELEPTPLPDNVDPDVLGVLCYTSGTTGRPKGARIPQRALEAGVEALHGAWGWRGDDVLLHSLPLFHIHGLFVAQHGVLRAGATAVWMDRFDATEALQRIVEHQVTIVMGVPTFYHRFLQHEGAVDVSSVRLFTSGSAPLPARDHERFRTRFGAAILERYGMTEVGIVLSNPLHGARRPGSVGHPLPGVGLRITGDDGEDVIRGEVGEVRIQGPSLFEGYHGRPEATMAAIGDGWMHTGDLGWQDEDGYVHLVGRQTDMNLRGGWRRCCCRSMGCRRPQCSACRTRISASGSQWPGPVAPPARRSRRPSRRWLPSSALWCSCRSTRCPATRWERCRRRCCEPATEPPTSETPPKGISPSSSLATWPSPWRAKGSSSTRPPFAAGWRRGSRVAPATGSPSWRERRSAS